MPTIRIDPGSRKNRLARASKLGGAALGTIAAAPLGPFAPIVGAVFGKVGSTLGKVFNPHKKTYPFTVDTETNTVTLLRKEAPITSKKGLKVQAALQSVWNTGLVPKELPKRYRDEAALLLQQRNEFMVQPETAAPAPVQTEGAQYTGEYSMAGFVPPGGFAGFSGMTAASKAAMGMIRRAAGGRKRKKRKSKKTGAKRKKRASKRKGRKLVKGSAAAKRFMANLRRKRK